MITNQEPIQVSPEYLNNMAETFEEYQKVFKEIEPYQKSMFSDLKDFMKLIIGLSAGIVGFAVPMFGKTDIINSLSLFKISLGGFLIAMIVGIIYLYKSILTDRKYIQKTTKILGETFSNTLQYIQNNKEETGPEQMVVENLGLAQSFTQDISKDLPALKAWDWTWHISAGIFVLSLILLFISII